ncbi:hypothetical protein D9615_009447 [Tricholomella constricta]|uniref:Peptidase A1 domain-containing protein n=1 Tax=Tricholomella constricta TaxID=117010 RepID=A0A8H5GYP3_9AGAR|nr:hypothetical protein D9615_009447 [Tricholomella constricta]
MSTPTFISIPISESRIGPRTDVLPLPPTIIPPAARESCHPQARTPDGVGYLHLRRRPPSSQPSSTAPLPLRYYHPVLCVQSRQQCQEGRASLLGENSSYYNTSPASGTVTTTARSTPPVTARRRSCSVRVGGKDMRWRNRTSIFDTGRHRKRTPTRTTAISPARGTTPTWTASAPGLSAPSTSKKPVFAPTLGGRTFNVDARGIAFLPLDKADPQGNCTSGITAGDVGRAEQWLVGDVFLKNVYMSTAVGSDTISFSKLKPPWGQ